LKKSFKPFKDEAERCWLLLVTSFASLLALIVLNIYIGYLIIKYLFFEDGWSFMASIMFMSSYIVTIPALIFSALSVRMIRYGNKKKYMFPVTFGIILILAGLILNNATQLWSSISILGLLLLISVIVCKKS
jgi:hypothetical protein